MVRFMLVAPTTVVMDRPLGIDFQSEYNIKQMA